MAYSLFHPRSPRPLPSSISLERFAREVDGESSVLEFKRGDSPKPIAEAVTAFSNTNGGVVLVGVDDDGSVRGVNAGEQKIAQLYSGIHSALHDHIRLEIHVLAVGDRDLLVVDVPRRSDGVTQMGDGRVLVRRGASNRVLMGDDLLSFAVSRTRAGIESAATEAKPADADGDLLEQLRVAWDWRVDEVEDRLVENHFASRDGGDVRLTVAGALFLLAEPQAVLGKTYVEILRFRDQSGEFDQRLEVMGDLPTQIQATVSVLMGMVGFDTAFVGLRRRDLPRLPEPVVREALANAVAHRSYRTTGAPVRVEVHAGHVDVISPGGFPDPVTPENIRGQSVARNRSVIGTLRRMELAEDVGRGVDRMQDAMEANLLPPPEFVEVADTVRVRLAMESAATPDERAWVLELSRTHELEPGDTRLLVEASRRGVVANSDVRNLLGVDEQEARRICERLKAAELLEQNGNRGGARYRVARTIGGGRWQPVAEEEIDRRVLALAQASDEPLTNELVRKGTGLDRVEALQALNRLVEAGHLIREGERRGTRYVKVAQKSKPSET